MNTTKIGKYLINYQNEKEFHSLKSEIFGEECYSIKLENDQPYIIDIGAYIGLSVIYFKSIYPNSKILAFEPNPYAREILEENIFINNLANIDVLPYAITDETNRKPFYIDTSANNWQSTGSFSKSSWNNELVNNTEVNVETRKLSTFLNDTVVDLLKIDVEGAELKILNECKNFLGSVKAIILEYHPGQKNSLKKILALLKNNGFKISFFQEGKEIKIPEEGKLLVLKCLRD